METMKNVTFRKQDSRGGEVFQKCARRIGERKGYPFHLSPNDTFQRIFSLFFYAEEILRYSEIVR
jgi:hypothetical protein